MGNALGNRIYSLRKAKGLTQEELGQRVGVTKAQINKYETGVTQNLKRSVAEAMAKALDVSPGYLMGWTDESVTHEREQSLSNDGERELLRIYRALGIRDRVKLLTLAIQLEDDMKA